MIIGCHSVIYSKDPEKDREFLKDALKLPYVDVGNGWLVFGLPPSEVAVHPSERNNVQELYLLCDNIKKTITQMKKMKVRCSPVTKQQWGLLTNLTLPGGGLLKMYQPLHKRPKSVRIAKSVQPPAKRNSIALKGLRKRVKRG
jgi:hypothetical protein